MLDDTIRERAAEAAARAWTKDAVPLDSFTPGVQGGFRRIVDAVAEVLDAPTQPPAKLEPAADAPSPIVLPTVEEVAQAIHETTSSGRFADVGDYTQARYRAEARHVLDLIASRVPAWVPVEPGAVKPGMVLKRTDRDGGYTVFTVKHVEEYDGDEYRLVRGTNGFHVCLNEHGFTWEVDPRTVPAEPEDQRVAVVAEVLDDEYGSYATGGPAPEPREYHRAAIDKILARLDALEADR